MAVDIGAGRQLRVNQYCLRYDTYNGYFLRHWEFQGSNDNTTWVMLRKHVGDEGLNKAYAVAHWPVEGKEAATPFRYFRLLQNGKNSWGDEFLQCCGIELWGVLTFA